VSYHIVCVKLTQGIFIQTEGRREKQTVFTDEEYMPTHTHLISSFAGAVCGEMKQQLTSKKYPDFLFIYLFHSQQRCYRIFSLPRSERGKKSRKEKDKSNHAHCTEYSKALAAAIQL